jgi:hypothetical protein
LKGPKNQKRLQFSIREKVRLKQKSQKNLLKSGKKSKKITSPAKKRKLPAPILKMNILMKPTNL